MTIPGHSEPNNLSLQLHLQNLHFVKCTIQGQRNATSVGKGRWGEGLGGIRKEGKKILCKLRERREETERRKRGMERRRKKETHFVLLNSLPSVACYPAL